MSQTLGKRQCVKYYKNAEDNSEVTSPDKGLKSSFKGNESVKTPVFTLSGDISRHQNSEFTGI